MANEYSIEVRRVAAAYSISLDELNDKINDCGYNYVEILGLDYWPLGVAILDSTFCINGWPNANQVKQYHLLDIMPNTVEKYSTATERIEWQREFTEKYSRELWPESWQKEL